MAAKKTATKSKAKAKPHGGRRKGAGRKPTAVAELRREILAEADQVLCDQLVPLLGKMLKLANGGFKRESERWELPDVLGHVDKPRELVLVGKSVEVVPPDREAIKYLIDRMLGRPHTAEVKKPEEGRQPLPAILEAALARAYGSEGDAEPKGVSE